MRDWRSRQRDDFSLREIAYVLRERRKLVAGIVLALGLLVLLFNLLREPAYTAEVVVSVDPQQRIEGSGEQEAFLQGVVNVVATDDLLRGAMRRAGWEKGFEDFRGRISAESFVTQEGETSLSVRFSGSSPEEAVRAANAYAELFVERVDELNERRLAGASLAADASLEREASPGEVSSDRHPLLYMVAAVVAGVMLGGAGALLLEGRARSWRDAHDAEMTLQAPVLGVIPDYSAFEETEG